MAKVRFEDGTVINFEGDPTSDDIEEAYQSVKGTPPSPSTVPPSRRIGDLPWWQKALLPSTLPREFVTQQATQGIRSAQEAMGSTPIGKGLELLFAPPKSPVGAVARTAMQPERLGQVVGQAADPLTYLGIKVAPAVGRGMASVGETFPITTAQKEGVLQKIRQGLLNAPKLAGKEFEQSLSALEAAHPNQRVDLSSVVWQLKQAIQTIPEVASLVSRGVKSSKVAGFIQSLLTQDPELSSDLTITQAQALKRVLQDALRNKFNQFAPELNDAHLELLDAYHGTRAAQLDAFPQFRDIASTYHQQLSKFRTLKPMFKAGELSSAIMGRLTHEPEIVQMAKQLLPEETLKQIRGFKTAQQVKKVATIGALGAGVSLTPPGRKLLSILFGD